MSIHFLEQFPIRIHGGASAQTHPIILLRSLKWVPVCWGLHRKGKLFSYKTVLPWGKWTPKHPLHERNSFKSKIFESGLSKSHKKVNFFFLLNQVFLNGQDYEKQKGSGTSDQSLFILLIKFKRIPLLVIYYLTKFDNVII